MQWLEVLQSVQDTTSAAPSTLSVRGRFSTRPVYTPSVLVQARKQLVLAAFAHALEREAVALLAEVRAKAAAITDLDDLWQLEQFLRDERRALEERYDYRYSVLLYVFADLIQAGWLNLDELTGLADDKRARIAALLELARERT